jgi:hypothetical protein
MAFEKETCNLENHIHALIEENIIESSERRFL